MLATLAIAESFALPSRVCFTLHGTLTLYGRRVRQVQYVTERYVVTEVDRATFVFLADRNERFLLDRDSSRLRRLDRPMRIGADRLRPVIGDIEVRVESGTVERRGFACRRYSFANANARVVIAGEVFTTRIGDMARTALHRERVLDANDQPFALPLESDEVVVESRLRTVASDFEQSQAYELATIQPGVADRAALDDIASFAVAV